MEQDEAPHRVDEAGREGQPGPVLLHVEGLRKPLRKPTGKDGRVGDLAEQGGVGVEVLPEFLHPLNHDDRGDLDEPEKADGAVNAFDFSLEAVVRRIDAPKDVEGDGRVVLHDVDERGGVRLSGGDKFFHLRDGGRKGRKREREALFLHGRVRS